VQFGALLSSVIAVWFFGTPVEQQAGRGHLFKILIGATLFGSFVEAALGRLVGSERVLAGAGPASMALIAAYGAIYGRTQVLFFGVQQMKASSVALLFLVLGGGAYLLDRDWLGFAGAAAGAAFGAYVVHRISLGRIRVLLDRARLWRLRRRYRVISGGRDTKRYLN
jgi:membrane associated rhomboid family serine protease